MMDEGMKEALKRRRGKALELSIEIKPSEDMRSDLAPPRKAGSLNEDEKDALHVDEEEPSSVESHGDEDQDEELIAKMLKQDQDGMQSEMIDGMGDYEKGQLMEKKGGSLGQRARAMLLAKKAAGEK